MTSVTSNAAEHILIACADSTLAEYFSTALGENYSVTTVTNACSACDIVENGTPALAIIDPKLFPDSLSDSVSRLVESRPEVHIVVIENHTDRVIDQYALFKAGAHGFCKENISTALLSRAVQMVLEGEYWIQRKLIAKMISDLARETSENRPHTEGRDNAIMETLTPRELEVAKMVRLGENNKMIARELDISERTVKAHLSAIFRKLDIQNRLHLALYFADIN